MNKRHGVALAVALGLMLSGFAHADEEEGHLELTEQQIQAAGIELATARKPTFPLVCCSTRGRCRRPKQ